MPDKNKLDQEIIPILKQAGQPLRENFGRIDNFTMKSNLGSDVLTELDKQTELFISTKLREFDPSIDFQGEEFGGSERSEKKWLCDPLDGTAHYVRGVAFCTTMLALIENGQVVYAAIYDFIRDNIFTAATGQGATKNGQSIQVSNRPLEQAYIFHEVNFLKKANVNTFIELSRHAVMLETINTGFEFTSIASGQYEARVQLDPFGHSWDYAAGSLLITEAGGIVRNLGSNTYDYTNYNLIASNKPVYDKLIADETLPRPS